MNKYVEIAEENLNIIQRIAVDYPLNRQSSAQVVLYGMDYMDNTQHADEVLYYPICKLGEVTHVDYRFGEWCSGNLLINMLCWAIDKNKWGGLKYNEEIKKNVLIYSYSEYDTIDSSKYPDITLQVIEHDSGNIKKKDIEDVIKDNEIQIMFFNIYKTQTIADEITEIISWLEVISKKYNVCIIAIWQDYADIYNFSYNRNVCLCKELWIYDYIDDFDLRYMIFEFGGMTPKKLFYELKSVEGNGGDRRYFALAPKFMILMRMVNFFRNIKDNTHTKELKKMMIGYFKFKFDETTMQNYIYKGVKCGMLSRHKNKGNYFYRFYPYFCEKLTDATVVRRVLEQISTGRK